MKRLMKLKNCSEEALNALSTHFIASSLSTLYKSMKKSPENRAKLSNTYVKAKTTMFFGFAAEIKNFWEIANGNHRFIASMH
jgi:hypothetical protein